MSDKLLNKLFKVLGEQVVNETRTLSAEQLESVIVSSTQEIEEAKAELQDNHKYQMIKEDKAYMEAGLKDLRKINNARIQLAVLLLSERCQKIASGE